MDKVLNEIVYFIGSNLKSFIKKKHGRLDYVFEDGKYTVKIYKCGETVTRIDIVKKED